MKDRDRIIVVDEDGESVDELRAVSDGDTDHSFDAEAVSFVHAERVEDAVVAVDSAPARAAVVTEYVVTGDAAYDGIDVVESVRDRASVPVVLFTADGSESVASRATLAGATAYVVKDQPDASAQALEAVRAAWRRSSNPELTPPSRNAANAAPSPDPDSKVEETEERNREKIETLHDVATDLETCETEEEVFSETIEAAEQVLEFDQCMLDVRRGDVLVPVATSSGLPEGGAQRTPIDAESVASRVARTREATINDDLSEVTDADPADMAFRSGFTVPVSDVGVFQAVAEETNAFDEDDLELAQLLVAHVAESLKRVRSRRELREERDRFAALFENVPDPAVRARIEDEANGPVVERVNGAFAETFGCDAETVVGDSLQSVVASPNGSESGGDGASGDGEASGVFATADGSVEVVDREVRREAVDGPRDFILHVIPIDTHEREVYGIYTDITRTKERERALERQNERLDEFASVVSHDLRNPLNLAEGHLVNFEQTGNEESLEEVKYAHERMRSLIEDLLELARSGTVVAEPEAVDLDQSAHRAWGSLHAPGAELVVEDTAVVFADTARIVDVFANLFRNAVEHGSPEHESVSPNGGVEGESAVTVRVGTLADEPGFFVADDGAGIPENEREAVFETGYTNAEDGSGFGLAIVDQIARAHDWSVSVTDAQDGGARFEFRGVECAD